MPQKSPPYHMPSDDGEPPWWDEDEDAEEMYPTERPECGGTGEVLVGITVYEAGCHVPHDDV